MIRFPGPIPELNPTRPSRQEFTLPSKTPWIERRFIFDLPAGMFPNVLERLRGTPARIRDRVQGLDPEPLRERGGKSWSIQENIGHMIEVEALWLGRLDDFAAGLDKLRPADMSNQKTETADHNSKELLAILGDFQRVRAEFVRRLGELGDAEIERSAHHPRLDQPMRILDLMIFAAEHDDHHLARITELLSSGQTPEFGDLGA
jgi:uncharacterized damage-inducible protein DinB